MSWTPRPSPSRSKPARSKPIRFYNTPSGGLTIIKKDEETGERIKGVEFEVRKLDGEIIGTYTTDRNGVINLPEAEKGWYQVVELKAAEGYRLDDTPYQIEVKDGQTATLEITNRRPERPHSQDRQRDRQGYLRREIPLVRRQGQPHWHL